SYDLNKSFLRQVDASLCRVLYDKRDTTFSALQEGDSIIIVSYKDEAKKIPAPKANISIEQQVENFPVPVIADEIHIRKRKKEEKKEEAGTRPLAKEEDKVTWQEIARMAGLGIGGLIVFIFLLPLLYLAYRYLRVSLAKRPTTKADEVYRTSLYRFHMAGLERDFETPLEYARTKVDPKLNAGFENFMRLYLRLKYSSGSLREGDQEIINQLAKNTGPSIRKKNGFFRSIFNYFNILLALRYFQQPEKTENEIPSL
ncbi:MAG TPA: hypothetical protein VFE57_12755, partial [Cyclobacteriaceae bacterium]|nr:hypothetical protein [Cyclobacteriaceae bacterium]